MTLHDAILAVRTGQQPSTVEKSKHRACCAACKFSIVALEWRTFVFEGRKAFLHCEAATCNSLIESAKAKKQMSGSGLVIKKPADYVPRRVGWTFTAEELAAAEVLADHRQPKRTTTCRVCLQDVTPSQERSLVVVRDKATGWTLRSAYTHSACVTKRSA
jgi:hypothetical protein